MAARKSPQKPPSAPFTAKAAVAVVVLGLLGATCGASLTVLVPDGGILPDARARFQLATDTAAGLKAAATIEDGNVTADAAIGALAHLLLWLEHGAGDEHRAIAERVIAKATPAARTSPEGLYCRALLADDGVADTTLDADLGAAAESPWVLLARARRLPDLADRLPLLERAALSAKPLPHANHQWARVALATGDVQLARAALDRVFRLAPRHAAGAITATVVGLVEDATLPEAQRRRRPDRKKNDGAPRPGEGPAPSLDDKRLTALGQKGLDELDDAQLTLTATAMALGAGREPPAGWADRVTAAAATSATTAQAAIELALFTGDVDLAETIAKSQKSIERLQLLTLVSHVRFLRAVPDAERRAAAKGEPRINQDGIELPLGTLHFAPERFGLPWRSVASPTFFPERRYQRLLAAVEGGGSREKLDPRLQAIEKLGLVDRAIARGDLSGADATLKEAKTLAGTDAAVALTEAALRARQNDPNGVKDAIEAALAAAPQDPSVLLAAARLSLDVDSLGGVRRALQSFGRLGLKASQASALTAIVEARSGDLGAARSALAEARRLGGSDDILTHRAAILTNRVLDVADARAAADALFLRGVEGAGGGDVVAAWLAEAAYRTGEQDRAEAALKAITTTRPSIGEAHLFYASTIRFNPARRAEAIKSVVTATKRLDRGPLLDEAKKLLVALKKQKRGR